MSDEKSETSEIIKATGEVLKAVPVYQDAVQPVAKEIGKSLQTAGRTVNALLGPLKAVVWGYERIEAYVSDRVGKKLEKTPPEQLQTPKASVAAPALEAVRFRGDDPDVQELFANLIAGSMDKRTAARIFPSFVEMIKQLTSDEAKVLRYLSDPVGPFPIIHIQRALLGANGSVAGYSRVASNLSLIGINAGCEHPYLIPSYLDNLQRLGLIRLFTDGTHYTAAGAYENVESFAEFENERARHDVPGVSKGEFRRSGLAITSLGTDFIQACVIPYEVRTQMVLDE